MIAQILAPILFLSAGVGAVISWESEGGVPTLELKPPCTMNVLIAERGPQALEPAVREVLEETERLVDLNFKVEAGWDVTQAQLESVARGGGVAVVWDYIDREGVIGNARDDGFGHWVTINTSHLVTHPSEEAFYNWSEADGNTWLPFDEEDLRLGIDELVRHEIGHVLGLGHVNDPRSIMHPTLRHYVGDDTWDAQTAALIKDRWDHC